MSTQPTTAAGREEVSGTEWDAPICYQTVEGRCTCLGIIEHDHVREKRYVGTCLDCQHNLVAPVIPVTAIEAEARQEDASALLRALVESYVPKGIHGQGGYYDAREWIAAHDAAVAFLAALPPSAPPALDVELLAEAIAGVGPVDMADTREAARAYAEDLAAEFHARLQEEN